MKSCSYCGRENDDHVFYCGECGTALTSEGDGAKGKASRHPANAAFEQQMIVGALVCIVGILVTVFTYSAAVNSSSGGIWVIAYGAIIGGALRFLRGLFKIAPSAKRRIVGYQDTAYHANLTPEAHTQPVEKIPGG
jgi:hypothetical protein